MSVNLSICIPTYNRADFIGETLESIISQITDDQIEIVISDNASTDNTEEIVHKFQERFSQITYFKWQENRGADRNYLKTVELARGNYCWLMGSDDVVVSGSVERILNEINSQHDIYLCNRTESDLYLRPFREKLWFKPNERDRIFEFKNRSHFVEYLDGSNSIGALFSYLSTIIVKKSSWDSTLFDEAFIGTAYSHTFILLSIVINGGTLKYIRDSLILCRLGNDSFATTGHVNRLLLDLNGYLGLSYLFVDHELKLKFLQVMTRTCPWYFLLQIKMLSEENQWLNVRQKLILFHFSKWKIIFVESLAFVKPLAAIILWMRLNLIRLLINYKIRGRLLCNTPTL